jgi:hypothetical protein
MRTDHRCDNTTTFTTSYATYRPCGDEPRRTRQLGSTPSVVPSVGCRLHALRASRPRNWEGILIVGGHTPHAARTPHACPPSSAALPHCRHAHTRNHSRAISCPRTQKTAAELNASPRLCRLLYAAQPSHRPYGESCDAKTLIQDARHHPRARRTHAGQYCITGSPARQRTHRPA